MVLERACTINYLDGVAVVRSDYIECANTKAGIISILQKLGFFISFNKPKSLAQCSRLSLGIDIDTVKLQL